MAMMEWTQSNMAPRQSQHSSSAPQKDDGLPLPVPFLPLFPLAVATRSIYNATVNTGDDAPGARQQVERRDGEACFVH